MLFAGQARVDTRSALLAPLAELRMIQSFTSQDASHRAGLRSVVHFREQALFVLGREPPAAGFLRFGYHLRVGNRGRTGVPRRGVWLALALRLAPLADALPPAGLHQGIRCL